MSYRTAKYTRLANRISDQLGGNVQSIQVWNNVLFVTKRSGSPTFLTKKTNTGEDWTKAKVGKVLTPTI